MSRFSTIARAIGDLVERKNAAYGDSIASAGKALRLLYPNGIAPQQMDDALLIGRIWDKLKRVATDYDALGESPYLDIAGYAILGVELHQGGNVGSGVCAPVSAKRMPQHGQATEGPVLQRRVPAEGSASAAQPSPEDMPEVRVPAGSARASEGLEEQDQSERGLEPEFARAEVWEV